MVVIMLTGCNGQVGWELRRALAPLGRLAAFDRGRLDLEDGAAVRRTVRDLKPDLIVNAAAYTAVDAAESAAARAHAVNALAPGILAEEAARCGAAIVHYSTDYVFDGRKPVPAGGAQGDNGYCEDEPTNPLGEYGRSKLVGEQAVAEGGAPYLILRTSWVYGMRGHNFLRTVLRLAGERDRLGMVADQFGAPTWSRMIAEATAQIVSRIMVTGTSIEDGMGQFSGIYHLTAGGVATWCAFARAIVEAAAGRPGSELLCKPSAIAEIRTEDYPLPARRPVNSLLSSKRIFDTFAISLPDWRTQLALCLDGADNLKAPV